jgi:hypothetical protein
MVFFFYVFLVGLFCFVFFSYHYFIMLVGLEVCMLSLFFLVSFFLFSGDILVSLVFVIVVVFMGGFGLCVIVAMARSESFGKYFF